MKAAASQQGFTLIQISILLIVAGIVMVNILPSARTALTANNATINKMNAILTSLRQYEAAYTALPCPADASQPTGSTNYGVAAANSGTTNNCSGGTPAANYTDTTNNIAIGMVPVRALGLSNDYALDAYGRDITYAVDTNATVCGWPTSTLTGQITVTDNGTNSSTIAALISHGADGHGAWLPLTGTTGTAVRLNAGSTDTDEHLVNAHGINGGGFPADYSTISSAVATEESTTATFVRKPVTTTFDDLVVYKSNLWTLNNLPASAPAISSVAGPSNGNYNTGQTLNFTVTYNTPVTVTTTGGTPYLSFSAIAGSIGTSNVAKATYQSGSGTVALVFSYTVTASDLAAGLTLASTVTLNGGTILSGNACAQTGFTAPSLTGVIVNERVYVSDTGGNRVEVFNASGTYLSQIGGCSSGGCSSSVANGAFGTNTSISIGVGGIAIDPYGNIWVDDTGNNRIEKFNSSGSWLSTVPSSGCSGSSPPACASSTTNGQFNLPTYIASDSSGNIYVSDQSNNRVEVFNNSGTYLMGIGAGYQGVGGSVGGTGTTSGKFNTPQGIRVDSSGNIWVVDSVNHRVQKFNSSGTWQQTVGSSGTGNGKFGSYPEGLAIDSSGNFWVGDNGNQRFEKFNSSGNYVSKFTAYNTNDIFIDPSGNLWVVSQGGFQVNEYNTSGSTLQSFGSSGTGSGQFSNAGGGNNSPSNLAVGFR
jgi:sugar lactone lactonase YvrE